MYAVLRSGGKQYTVRENDIIELEKLDVPAGQEVVLGDILFVSGDKGAMVGSPVVEGAKITGKVLSQCLGDKITGFTYKSKKNEHRRYGHRQPLTRIRVEKIDY